MRRRRHRSFIALSTVILLACGPSFPSETEAREALIRHQAVIKELDQALWSAAQETPFGVLGRELKCSPPTAEQPPAGMLADDPVLRDLIADTNCTSKRIDHYEAQRTATIQVADELTPTLFREARALGAEARLTFGESGYNFGRQRPFPAGYRRGTIVAADGIEVDGKMLGYGLYSDQWSDETGSYGTSGYQRAIEVRWTRQEGEMLLSVGILLPVPP